MDPDITINVNLNPAGAATEAQGGAMTAAAAVGPAPMALGELMQTGGGSADAAPAPMTLGGAQAASSDAVRTDAGEPPPPMSMGMLGGAMQPDAPAPDQLEALAGSGASAPPPSAEMLGAAGSGDAPAPMPIEDLEGEAGDGRPGRKK